MALINLVFHRIIQRNAGTALRPEWAHHERPSRITCSVPRMYERDPSQPVHFFGGSVSCVACNSNFAEVWTDDSELWERHPQRCNVAYQP